MVGTGRFGTSIVGLLHTDCEHGVIRYGHATPDIDISCLIVRNLASISRIAAPVSDHFRTFSHEAECGQFRSYAKGCYGLRRRRTGASTTTAYIRGHSAVIHVPLTSVRQGATPACIVVSSASTAAMGWPCELAPQEIGVVSLEKTASQAAADGSPARPP
jgi:hypothetical protein